MNNNQSITKYFKLFSLVAVLLIIIGGVGAWALRGSVDGNTITLEEVLNVEGVENVSIRTDIQRVRIHHAPNNEARIILSGIPTNATLIAEVVNDVLTIETRWTRQVQVGVNFATLHAPSPTLDAYLPTIMYEKITINTSTGRVEISDFMVNDLQIGTTTGAVQVSDIVGDVNVSTSTGRIIASKITGEDLHFQATTGAIELSDITGDIKGQTSTGNITLNNSTIAQNINLQATTGGIELNIESEPTSAMLSLSTTLGSTTIFGNNNSTQQFGDGRYDVTLRTTTGRITVQ